MQTSWLYRYYNDTQAEIMARQTKYINRQIKQFSLDLFFLKIYIVFIKLSEKYLVLLLKKKKKKKKPKTFFLNIKILVV